jgi:hypothetical protein
MGHIGPILSKPQYLWVNIRETRGLKKKSSWKRGDIFRERCIGILVLSKRVSKQIKNYFINKI